MKKTYSEPKRVLKNLVDTKNHKTIKPQKVTIEPFNPDGYK